MGKRSPGFERRPQDHYVTPRAAFEPLIPWLDGLFSFAEPCEGDGTLKKHLQSLGLKCTYAGDLSQGDDALDLIDYGEPDAIITNPPYRRGPMHQMIVHFQKIAPTWLLLEMDWISTWQAAPYLAQCSDIVSIGRVKWIPGSPFTGKDNYGWMRFDKQWERGPRFHWRGRLPD